MSSISTQTPRNNRLWPRLFRLCAFLLLLGLLTPLYPPFFQKEVKVLLWGTAFRNHLKLKIGPVSGSLWEPVKLRNVVLSETGKDGTQTQLRVATALFSFSGKNVVLKRGVGWFQKLALEDVELAITLPSNPPVSDGKSESGKKERRYLKIPFPVELEAQQVNVTVSQGEEYLKIREMQFC